MIETEIDSVRVDLLRQRRVLLLKEIQGERHLPIWIGEFEASAIMIEMEGTATQRPLPYDLMATMLRELDARVVRIEVNDLSRDIYYARIVIERQGSEFELDARPSDAIAIALRAQCTIFVDDAVMEKAGIVINDDDDDSDDGQTVEAVGRDDNETPVAEEGLTLFRDFINTLDLDDPEKRTS
ncbi:MAG TPA: bifunctional nuclease family protein [Thermomicrobiales bacterium]|nr:bifunctional nuclease family protein [Thermomicrobiales bacterium]